MGALAEDGFVSHLVSLPAHSGTHIDAPGHVIEDGALLADLPLSRFCGPGVVLDVRGRAERAVTAADIGPLLGHARGAAFALLRTGDEARWGSDGYYTRGAYIAPEAAALLAAVPGLSGIGLDAGSVDPADSRGLPAHKALLGAGLVIVENLRGLGQLPAASEPGRGFTFFCLPVLGCDGSPVRAAVLLSGGAE